MSFGARDCPPIDGTVGAPVLQCVALSTSQCVGPRIEVREGVHSPPATKDGRLPAELEPDRAAAANCSLGQDRAQRGHFSVTDTLQLALAASGCDSAHVVHKPRLLSDNGSSYVSAELAEWLDGTGMDHVRGAPNHPQTQGKIERWHQTLKNRILLENYYLPGDLERAVHRFVEHYNHARYHESLGNLTPADVYCGRGATILSMREKIKRQTIQLRRLPHFKTAA
jgi:hypothetical protein